jgi:acyl-coenzyme A synthetase/AMP-(fatty) acid ligase
VPRYVFFREEMPLTVTEKIFKRALRDEVSAELERDAGPPSHED